MATNEISTEEWRDIAGWEGLYQVSSDGRVRSLPRERVRITGAVQCTIRYESKIINGGIVNGYRKVGLQDKVSRLKRYYVHHLVCTAFHGPRPEGPEVAHGDGSRTNNCFNNLRWASRLENQRDREAHGTKRHRDSYKHAKVTTEDLRLIDEMLDQGFTQQKIADRFGIGRPYVSHLRSHILKKGARHGR